MIRWPNPGSNTCPYSSATKWRDAAICRTWSKITDNTSGFRAYNRTAIHFLADHYPDEYPEPEAVILLGKNGFKISEVETRMRERQGGDSSISGVKSGYYMIKVLLAILMTALRKPVTNRLTQSSRSSTTTHDQEKPQ